MKVVLFHISGYNTRVLSAVRDVILPYLERIVSNFKVNQVLLLLEHFADAVMVIKNERNIIVILKWNGIINFYAALQQEKRVKNHVIIHSKKPENE
jgi:hypothetical protein